MITKLALVFVASLILVAGDFGDDMEDEVPTTHMPHLLSTATSVDAVIGESVTFPCRVDDLGVFVQLWKKGKTDVLFAADVRVVRDERFQVVDETSLHISGVRPKDSGEYVCQISTTPALELSHMLNVLYPPSVKTRPKDGLVTAKEGEKITLACEAMGNPEPEISWKHAGRHYESVNGKGFAISGVQKSDAGEYECIADNGVGDSATAIITVEVVSAPKIYPQPEDGLVIVKEGETVSIACDATGDPTPVITWKKPGGEKTHNTRDSTKIIITEANRSHAGSYECIANNSLGIFTSAEIKVQVLYAPEIQVPIQGLHTSEGTTVELTCMVRGEPVPTVTWKRNEKALHSNEHYHIKTVGHDHILQIRHMRDRDFGQYECIASNSLSTASETIEVTGKPNVPSFTSKPHASQSRRYTLEWMVESHSPVDEYSLMYRKKSEGEDWITVNVEAAEEEGLHKTQSYQLTNLEPGTTYEAVATAHNKFGFGKQSETFDFTTKVEVHPTRMTQEPTIAAAVVEEGMSDSNEQSWTGNEGDRCRCCAVFVFIAALLCILRPFAP